MRSNNNNYYLIHHLELFNLGQMTYFLLVPIPHLYYGDKVDSVAVKYTKSPTCEPSS